MGPLTISNPEHTNVHLGHVHFILHKRPEFETRLYVIQVSILITTVLVLALPHDCTRSGQAGDTVNRYILLVTRTLLPMQPSIYTWTWKGYRKLISKVIIAFFWICDENRTFLIASCYRQRSCSHTEIWVDVIGWFTTVAKQRTRHSNISALLMGNQVAASDDLLFWKECRSLKL